MFDRNDFAFRWMGIKPCDDKQADYIAMKMSQQRKICDSCYECIGNACDIYTSSEEEARLGKYLIEQKIR